MAELLDGKKTSAEVREQIASETTKLVNNGGKQPHLAVVIVGNDPASETYVKNKMAACEKVGFKSSHIHYDAEVSEEELLQKIDTLNHDEDVDGFIVQLPLPKHIAQRKVTENISPEKDVDGFHPVNIGRMAKNLPSFVSATPFGILKLLEWYNIETSGLHCVILGRSEIVGSPLSILMARNTYPGNCTVTICHSRTRDLPAMARQADILIAAMGKPDFVTADMVKEGAIVIDVGTTRVEDATKKKGYRLQGDVAFEEVEAKCSYITPVPGGVGPMTIASLLNNTLQAAKNKTMANK